MIKWFFALLLATTLAPALFGAPLKFDALKVGSRVYRDVTILGHNETDLYFTYGGGITNVKMKYLSPDLQKRFDYDSNVAELIERQQARDDAAFHESVGQAMAAEAEKAIISSYQASASSEDNLADPLSERSLLNKPAPKLTAAKWLGGPPATEGKAVLVFFWTTWSFPCRKAISELNDYEKKFADRLAIVGLSPQPEQEVADFAEPKAEFALGVDPVSKFATTAGVTSVPQVVFIDAKGIVRYQGHPAALDAAKLEKLLAPAAE